MDRKASHRRAHRIWLWCTIAALGCSDREIAAPSYEAPVAPRPTVLPSGGSYSIPLPSDNQAPDFGGAPLAPTGILIPDSTSNFRMVVAAPFTLRDNPECQTGVWMYTYSIDGNGWDGPWPFPLSNPLRIQWAVQGAPGEPRSGGEERPGGSWVRIHQWAGGGGSLMLGRTPLYDDDTCNNGAPALLLSGSQVVTIDFVDAPITLSNTHVTAGTSIRASSTPINFTTVRSVTWLFHRDDGTITFVCQGQQLTCDFAPSTSGYLRVLVNTIGGNVISKSQHITVVKCPTGDPVLDNLAVRQDLVNLMKASNPDSTPGSGINPADWINTGWKKERALWVIRRGDGSYYTQPAPGQATECSIRPDFQSFVLGDGEELRALVHTHPARAGEKTFGDCVAMLPDGTVQHVARFPGDAYVQGYAQREWNTGGGSLADWSVAAGSQIDVYVMTKSGEIWRLPAGKEWKDRFSDRASRRKYWKKGSCTWP